MATSVLTKPAAKGGSFLLESPAPQDIFTPADLTDDQKLIGQTAEEFVVKEVLPYVKELEAKKPGLMAELTRKAAELGLMSGGTPEEYGGAGSIKMAATILTEKISIYGGFATTHGAHAGIGTLPLVYFGTEEQKKKYLPKLASGEFIGAYCLSEPQAGSDAQNLLTRAELNKEGTHYILNGQKMWITNGGFADLFIVFAKVDGEKLTAFIVETHVPRLQARQRRAQDGHPWQLHHSNLPGKLQGPEGKRAPRNRPRTYRRIQRAECRTLYVGCFLRGRFQARAHDRFQIFQRAQSLRQIDRRIRFDEGKAGGNGHPDVRRGVDDLPQRRLHGSDHARRRRVPATQTQNTMKVLEEYAIESSIAKVYGSEMLDFVVDEAVQIFGGYGFHEDYPVCRAYRDSRINRIFEGTNEINRMLIIQMLMKRAMGGQIALIPAATKLADEILAGPSFEEAPEGVLAEEARTVANAKKIFLQAAGGAHAEVSRKAGRRAGTDRRAREHRHGNLRHGV